MMPRKEPRVPSESNFLDFGQLDEVIANAIQSSLRPPQMTTLEAMSHLQISNCFGSIMLRKLSELCSVRELFQKNGRSRQPLGFYI